MTDETASIIEGLSAAPKRISSKYFYDEAGSKLFEDITRLPEYYPTATEIGILEANADEIAGLIGPQASLIEFGSGSSLKIRILLEHAEDLAVYVPVDISADHLAESAAQLRHDFPGLEIIPVVADFMRPFRLPSPAIMPRRNIVFFPGSTLGNFERDDALGLLCVMYQEAGEDGALLIGVDLQKDPRIIERAYNDSAGITADFNRNILRHLNTRFGADFDVDAYTHSAVYDAAHGRIEMRLVSRGEQVVRVGDATISIADGEAITTEYSHKYTLDGFAALAQEAGFRLQQAWTDADDLFAVLYCTRR